MIFKKLTFALFFLNNSKVKKISALLQVFFLSGCYFDSTKLIYLSKPAENSFIGLKGWCPLKIYIVWNYLLPETQQHYVDPKDGYINFQNRLV
jgi:hypothetical protein